MSAYLRPVLAAVQRPARNPYQLEDVRRAIRIWHLGKPGLDMTTCFYCLRLSPSLALIRNDSMNDRIVSNGVMGMHDPISMALDTKYLPVWCKYSTQSP